MIGKFGYRENCAVPHFIPDGEYVDGHPVIVFPQQQTGIVVGKTYDFSIMPTRQAKYTIDGLVYRVAHAIAPRDVDDKEADFIDRLVHTPHERATTSLADSLAPEIRAKLEAMRARQNV